MKSIIKALKVAFGPWRPNPDSLYSVEQQRAIYEKYRAEEIQLMLIMGASLTIGTICGWFLRGVYI